MYETFDIRSIRQSWNCMMANEAASFLPPSGYHEIEQTVRFTCVCKRNRGLWKQPATGLNAYGFAEWGVSTRLLI